MEKNIRDFSKFTALLLERLYRSFPNPAIIALEEIDENADRETIMTYRATIEFLTLEGIIRYRATSTDNVYLDVALTAKGLTLLNAVPDCLKEKKPFIHAIKETIKEGSKTALKIVVEALLKESLK